MSPKPNVSSKCILYCQFFLYWYEDSPTIIFNTLWRKHSLRNSLQERTLITIDIKLLLSCVSTLANSAPWCLQNACVVKTTVISIGGGAFLSNILKIERKRHYYKRKGRHLTQSYEKAPTPTEKSKKQSDNTKTPPKNFDYTTIADRFKTVSCSIKSHSTSVFKPVYGILTFPLTAITVWWKGHTFKYDYTGKMVSTCIQVNL